MMMFWRLVLIVFTLISLVSQQSDALNFDFFKHLAQPVNNSQAKLDNQVSPSPSPVNENSGGDQVPIPQPTALTIALDTCAKASNKCCDDRVNMTACYLPAGNGHQESFLLVVNDGESPLTLKLTLSSADKTYGNIQIPKHALKQINISSKIGKSPSIMLNAGGVNCTFNTGHSVSQGSFIFPYTTYVTPINGAYMLGVTAFLLGGICICYKFRKDDRHLDGVAYQELEMGKSDSLSSLKLETTEGWDESWDDDDDDWDEEKAVKSPGVKLTSNKLAKGSNDWDV